MRSAPALYDLVDVVLSRYRMLHILVNNAGLGWRAKLPELPRDQATAMLEAANQVCP